jgi:pyrimidine-nucleoside phosphorylase
MREEARARELARALVETGNSCGVRTEALITDMNQPLGAAVGNALETKECIEILRGEVSEGSRPVLELSLELAARMVAIAGVESSLDAARNAVRSALDSGAALELFRRNVEEQGGDARVCDDPKRLIPLTLRSVRVESGQDGFVTGVDTAEVGRAVAIIGGGRTHMTDVIDPAVGFISEAKIGDKVTRGQSFGTLYFHDERLGAEAAEIIRASYIVSEEAPAQLPALIKEVITA